MLLTIHFDNESALQAGEVESRMRKTIFFIKVSLKVYLDNNKFLPGTAK
jgi:hypothetical protein